MLLTGFVMSECYCNIHCDGYTYIWTILIILYYIFTIWLTLYCDYRGFEVRTFMVAWNCKIRFSTIRMNYYAMLEAQCCLWISNIPRHVAAIVALLLAFRNEEFHGWSIGNPIPNTKFWKTVVIVIELSKQVGCVFANK